MTPEQQQKNGVMGCKKHITLYKPLSWQMNQATWEFRVPFSSVDFQELNKIADDAVFDIVGWVIYVSEPFAEGGMQKRRLTIERGDTTVTMDLLGKHASVEVKPGDSLAAK